MSNPWIKSNPFMSMWLSGFNAMLGASRGIMTAEANRQATAMMNQSIKMMTDFWLAMLVPPGTGGARRRR